MGVAATESVSPEETDEVGDDEQGRDVVRVSEGMRVAAGEEEDAGELSCLTLELLDGRVAGCWSDACPEWFDPRGASSAQVSSPATGGSGDGAFSVRPRASWPAGEDDAADDGEELADPPSSSPEVDEAGEWRSASPTGDVECAFAPASPAAPPEAGSSTLSERRRTSSGEWMASSRRSGDPWCCCALVLSLAWWRSVVPALAAVQVLAWLTALRLVLALATLPTGELAAFWVKTGISRACVGIILRAGLSLRSSSHSAVMPESAAACSSCTEEHRQYLGSQEWGEW